MADHLTLAVLMQKIGHAGRKASIPAVLVLFVEEAYFLPENVSTLIETTTTKDNKVMVKTSLFQDKTVAVT